MRTRMRFSLTWVVIAVFHVTNYKLIDGATAATSNECPSKHKMDWTKNEILTCTCAGYGRRKPAWGTFVYTDDSDICTAARHAGAIREKDGEVTVVAQKGVKAYEGSTRYGITTDKYGYWPRAFSFRGVSPTSTASASATASSSYTPIPSMSVSATASATVTPTASSSTTPSSTASTTVSVTPTSTSTPSVSMSTSSSATPSSSSIPTSSPTSSSSASPTSSPSLSPAPSVSLTPTAKLTTTPTTTPTATPTATTTPTATPSTSSTASFTPRPSIYSFGNSTDSFNSTKGPLICPYSIFVSRSRYDHFECMCGPPSYTYGPVYGTYNYTDDSHLCNAALHAGVMGSNGGIIQVLQVPGQKFYKGSYSNGIHSSDNGAYPRSIRFSGSNENMIAANYAMNGNTTAHNYSVSENLTANNYSVATPMASPNFELEEPTASSEL